MRIPIFLKENKNTYKDEYLQIIKVLSSKCLIYEKNSYSYFEFINSYLFHNWEYRGTYLDVYSYLESIGINLNNKKIHEENFLSFLEFILNINLLLESKKYKSITFSDKASSILFHNIPIIIDNLGYSIYDIDDKIYILNKDIEYDNLMELVPNDLYPLIMSYNLPSNKGIKMKRIILNKIYNIINDKYKVYNPSVYSSIKTIITKMGIIGDIDKKYKSLSTYKLKKYYDYCLEMIIYLVKSKAIYEFRDEVKAE
ncbi:MAG: DUF2551 domain-containing protein [Bacilli bacterium]|nr:DUF2551 domain-containing protein [Bacilli bacterium]MBR6137536.1 DUF2551 domain-containing protein [Bacilli bacterium]